MEFWLIKFVACFVMPLGLALITLSVAVVLILSGRSRTGAIMAATVVAGLWLLSTQWFSNRLVVAVEGRYLPKPVSESRNADAILLLSGGVIPALTPQIRSDPGGSADRILQAAALFRAKKAPTVVVTGGVATFGSVAPPDAQILKDLLVDSGVPADAILLESASRTTHENCTATEPLLHLHHIRSVLLVTSALHMRRALAACRTAGIDAIPSPSGSDALPGSSTTVMDWRPESQGLDRSSRAMWEILGFAYYRARGWIRPGWQRHAPAR